MSTIKVVGLLAIDKDQIAEARKRPFLGLFFVDDDGDSTLRMRSLDDLGVVKSEYDAADQSWYFELELHEDDWWNADREPLKSLLAELPLRAGRGIVIAREAWKSAPSDVLLVSEGEGVVSKMVVDENGDDADLITIDRATGLVIAMRWPRATAVFESLKSAG